VAQDMYGDTFWGCFEWARQPPFSTTHVLHSRIGRIFGLTYMKNLLKAIFIRLEQF
jgi:hypothetical protein